MKSCRLYKDCEIPKNFTQQMHRALCLRKDLQPEQPNHNTQLLTEVCEGNKYSITANSQLIWEKLTCCTAPINANNGAVGFCTKSFLPALKIYIFSFSSSFVWWKTQMDVFPMSHSLHWHNTEDKSSFSDLANYWPVNHTEKATRRLD